MRVCNYRWEAPRWDVPESVPVIHVCALALSHYGEHLCSCGAPEYNRDDDEMVRERARQEGSYVLSDPRPGSLRDHRQPERGTPCQPTR